MTALRRVCVTGLSAITTAGESVDVLWEAAMAGSPLVRPFASPGADTPLWWVGASLFAPSLGERSPGRRDLDRSGAMLYAAALRAWADAGLDEGAPGDPTRSGLVAASAAGTMAAMLDAYGRWLGGEPAAPRDLLRGATGLAGALAADRLGLLGSVLNLSGGSVAGTTAIGEAWLKVATGQLDRCIAVAAEAPLHAGVLAQFGAARILAEGGPDACRPFERGRHGTQLGEGAVALVLESEDAAQARVARSYGRIAGFGATGDGVHQAIAPHPEGAGLARAIRQAIACAGCAARDVDLVMLHGTGTVLNDAAEARAFASVYGGAGATLPMASATKPVTGHCLGASGAVEAVIAFGALARGEVPPTPNLDEPDPSLAVPVSRQLRRKLMRVAVVHSVGFGGRNAALVLTRG